jgi:hypothetical protein
METKITNRVAEKIIGSIGTLAEERPASNVAIDDVYEGFSGLLLKSACLEERYLQA